MIKTDCILWLLLKKRDSFKYDWDTTIVLQHALHFILNAWYRSTSLIWCRNKIHDSFEYKWALRICSVVWMLHAGAFCSHTPGLRSGSSSLRRLPHSHTALRGLEESVGYPSDQHRRVSSSQASPLPPWLHPQRDQREGPRKAHTYKRTHVLSSCCRFSQGSLVFLWSPVNMTVRGWVNITLPLPPRITHAPD